jgi:hypothetical protein
MLKIDNSLLEELNLGSLPDPEKNSLLKHIYETLEMRVGMRLADQMTNEQLDEFEQYFEAKDDAGAFKWLETNFPNYKDIVQEEFDKLKGEVGLSAPQILAASQTMQAQPLGAPQPVTPPAPAYAPVPQTQAPAESYANPVTQQAQPAESYVPAQPQVSDYQPAPQPYTPSQQPPAGPGPVSQ